MSLQFREDVFFAGRRLLSCAGRSRVSWRTGGPGSAAARNERSR